MTESFKNLNTMSGESKFLEPRENKHRWELTYGSYMETTHDITSWKNIILREANEKYKLIPVQIDRIGISNQDFSTSYNQTNLDLNKLALHWNKMSNRNNNNIIDTRKKCIDLDRKFKIFDLTHKNGFLQCTEYFQNIGENSQMNFSGLNNCGTDI